MTLKECYESFGGDYDGVVGRLMGETLVKKFVLKFLDDQNFALLQTALDAHNREEAFRAAHTIKGVCQNLGFTALQESSGLLTEHLRTSFSDDCFAIMNRVSADYKKVIDAITEFRDSGA